MNTAQNFDTAVLIGRFQPFHTGHAALLAQALDTAPHVVVILGSAHQARNAKNPFTWEERAAMIRATLDEEQQARIDFVPVRDCYDDRRWKEAVQQAVAQKTVSRRIALIGFVKDASSQYLNRFAEWQLVATGQHGEVHATHLRRIYFETDDPAASQALLGELVPASVAHYLKGWTHLPHYARLREEHLAIEESRKIWGNGPFITVDAVVEASGHVLLIQRGRAPGLGSWALPGGFLDGRERVLQGAIRELREETGLALLDSTLEGALKNVAVFDHPDRSLRGRTVTHAHHFDLGSTRLPEVAGADDAATARWVAIADLPGMEDRFFEDHFHILDHFLSLTID